MMSLHNLSSMFPVPHILIRRTVRHCSHRYPASNAERRSCAKAKGRLVRHLSQLLKESVHSRRIKNREESYMLTLHQMAKYYAVNSATGIARIVGKGKRIPLRFTDLLSGFERRTV